MDKIVPIVREDHDAAYTGKPFFTLILYQDTPYIAIVDNYHNKHINCFVLDFCEAYYIDINVILNVAESWWGNKTDQPFSIYLSVNGLSSIVQPIFRTFHEDHVTRVIGPLPMFEMTKVISVKRRKYRELKDIPINKAQKNQS